MFNSNGDVLKKGKDPSDVLATEEFTSFLDDTEDSKAWFCVGHTRYSTRGKVCDENSHPFVYGDVIGAHNGCIEAPSEYSVDSEFAIDMLNKHESNYQTALQDEWGYWTLSWYDKRKDELFISMYHNTCGVVKYRGAWYFSSDPNHLATVLGVRDTIVLTDGQTMSFGPNGSMKWRAKFESNVEYSYRKNARTSGGKSSRSTGCSTIQTTYKGSTGNITTSTGSATGIKVNDTDSAIKDFDAEFQTIWQEYSANFVS